ncbi:MAG: histidinol dehydrogenase, partial [bacterium]
VKARLEEIVPDLPRRELIQPSLENHGAIIVVDEIDEGIEISNLIAPEHLEVLLQDESKIDKIRNAGAIFVGRWSSEPVGDYFAGPNHTIPTSGAAKYASPLGVADFVKQSSYIKYSEERLRKEGEMIAEFADLEELHAHAEAIRVRLNS